MTRKKHKFRIFCHQQICAAFLPKPLFSRLNPRPCDSFGIGRTGGGGPPAAAPHPASSAWRRRRRLLRIVRYSEIIVPCFIFLLSPRTVHRSRRAPTVPSLHEPVTSSRPMHRPTRPPRASRLRWPTRDPRSPSRHPPHTAASSRRGPPRGGYSGPGTHTYYLRLASLT